MNSTVFLTVFSGVVTFVVGQVLLKMVLDPVHEMKKTIGQISHSLVEYANVIANPGVPTEDAMREASKQLRKLSSQLHGHLYLVPVYPATARVFQLPNRNAVLSAAKALIGLSNGVHRATEGIYEVNASGVQKVRDNLGIFVSPEERYESADN